MLQNAKNINDWATQQKREKAAAAQAEKEEEMAYAMQTEAITRMRGMLEDEANNKRANMMKEMQEENKRLALQKKMREEAWKKDQADQDFSETTLTNHNEQLGLDGRTTRSM